MRGPHGGMAVTPAAAVVFVIGLGLFAGCSGGGSGDSGRSTVAFCTEARKLQGELQGVTPTAPLLIAKTIESYIGRSRRSRRARSTTT